MKNKPIISLFACTLLAACALACSAGGRSGDGGAKPVKLDRERFLTEVYDFRSETEWKYLGDKPALIDFYAVWCAPCRRVAPILDSLAEEYDGRIVIYKVDADREAELSALFDISAVPTLVFVPVGGRPQAVQGAMDRNALKAAIERILLKK